MKWFCFFKAYGDFVIACRFLRDQPKDRYGLICGMHLQELSGAIGFPGAIKWADAGNEGVPALFDVKKCGVYKAARSALKIREAIHSKFDESDPLVFDNVSIRERMLSWPRNSEDIKSGEPNIYMDYAKYFGATLDVPGKRADRKIRSVALFPDARLTEKALTDKMINAIIDECNKVGISAEVIRVTRFDVLVKSVNSYDAVISTDSLPAHLAEHYGVPVFVVTPRRNDYWMPFSAFRDKAFTLFDDLKPLKIWLSANAN